MKTRTLAALGSSAFTALAEAARLEPPVAAVVLGSGLAPLARRLRRVRTLSFIDIPGLPAPSVLGHPGTVTLGEWAGKPVLVFEGRLHYYEGLPWRAVTLPVQTAAFLGARALLLTNAAGGIHEALTPGSMMAIRDHLEWTHAYCWRRPGPGGIGTARSAPYAPRLLGLLAEAAGRAGVNLRQGIYAAVTGPNYETPAEIRALKACGADAVGMSTTREVQAGFEARMECAAVSLITNRAAGLSSGPITHEEVQSAAAAQGERLALLIEEFLRCL